MIVNTQKKVSYNICIYFSELSSCKLLRWPHSSADSLRFAMKVKGKFRTVTTLLFYILHGVTVIKSVYLRAFTCLNLQNLTINFHFKFIIRSYPVVIYRCVTSWSIVVLINRREGIMVKNVVLNVLFIETKKMSRTLKRSRPFIVMRVRSMRGSLRPLADQPNQVQSTRTECDSLNVLHR